MEKNLNKITQLSDESLVGQWIRSGRNEYVSALLMRYLSFIYGFFLHTATNVDKAKAEVKLFIQRFPSLLQKYGGKEDFASWLKGELGAFPGERNVQNQEALRKYLKGDAATAQTDASQSDVYILEFPDGCAAEDDHAKIIAELENEIKNSYPTQRKRYTGVVILIVVAVAAATLFTCLFFSRTDKKPVNQGAGIEAVTLPVADTLARTHNPVESGTADENIERNTDGIVTDNNPETLESESSQPEIIAPSQLENGLYAGHVRLVSISKKPDTNGDGGSDYVSIPKIGLRGYNEYLNKAAMRLEEDISGEVTLMFNVNRYGRPSQIRVTGFLSREAHRESLRLLDNGPEWSPTDIPVTIIIRFE